MGGAVGGLSILHAARRMGASPSACVVVEDSVYGVQAANGVVLITTLTSPTTPVLRIMRVQRSALVSINTVMTDAIPPDVTYVPGSLQITAGGLGDPRRTPRSPRRAAVVRTR